MAILSSGLGMGEEKQTWHINLKCSFIFHRELFIFIRELIYMEEMETQKKTKCLKVG
jgi:hypothetical protein